MPSKIQGRDHGALFSKSPLDNHPDLIDYILNRGFSHFDQNDMEWRNYFANHSTHITGSFVALWDRFLEWEKHGGSGEGVDKTSSKQGSGSDTSRGSGSDALQGSGSDTLQGSESGSKSIKLSPKRNIGSSTTQGIKPTESSKTHDVEPSTTQSTESMDDKDTPKDPLNKDIEPKPHVPVIESIITEEQRAGSTQENLPAWDKYSNRIRSMNSYLDYYEASLDKRGEHDDEILQRLLNGESNLIWKELAGVGPLDKRAKKEYATLLAYFNHMEGNQDLLDWKMKDKSIELLNEIIPKVAQSAWGAAFHGIIEVGWRLESGLCVAPGLAYTLLRSLDLGKPTKLTSESIDDKKAYVKEISEEMLNIIQKLADDDEWKSKVDSSGRFVDCMKAVSENNGCLDEYDLPISSEVDYTTLQDICEELNKILFLLFTKSEKKGDFFILHGITSLHALRYILGHLKKQEDRIHLFQCYWRGLLGVYISIGMPRILENVDQEESEGKSSEMEVWRRLEDIAMQFPHIDEHWYKLFHVAIFTSERRPDLTPIVQEAVDLYHKCVIERKIGEREK